MKACYSDILKLTKKQPLWYDENGVPRYCKFTPSDLPSIYARIAVLMEIQCQACGKPFLVGIGSDKHTSPPFTKAQLKKYPALEPLQRFLKDLAAWKKSPRNTSPPFYYGDPPRHGGKGCIAGGTMNSEVVRIVEYWEKGNITEWKRFKRLEGR